MPPDGFTVAVPLAVPQVAFKVVVLAVGLGFIVTVPLPVFEHPAKV